MRKQPIDIDMMKVWAVQQLTGLEETIDQAFIELNKYQERYKQICLGKVEPKTLELYNQWLKQRTPLSGS